MAVTPRAAGSGVRLRRIGRPADWGPRRVGHRTGVGGAKTTARQNAPGSRDTGNSNGKVVSCWEGPLVAGRRVGFAGAVGASGRLVFVPPRDATATALLQVSMRQEEFKIYASTRREVLRSPFVLTTALRKPEVSSLAIIQREKPNEIAWVQDHLEVSFPGDAEVIQVDLTGGDPEEAVILRARLSTPISARSSTANEPSKTAGMPRSAKSTATRKKKCEGRARPSSNWPRNWERPTPRRSHCSRSSTSKR